MENETLDYIIEYSSFEGKFKKTEVSAEEVGELIMHMTGHFIRYNVRFAESLRAFSAVKAKFQNQVDPLSGKAMSTSKAEILADDTTEAAIYQMAKIHVNNIQEILNSMKSLQKAIMQEYSNTA